MTKKTKREVKAEVKAAQTLARVDALLARCEEMQRIPQSKDAHRAACVASYSHAFGVTELPPSLMARFEPHIEWAWGLLLEASC